MHLSAPTFATYSNDLEKKPTKLQEIAARFGSGVYLYYTPRAESEQLSYRNERLLVPHSSGVGGINESFYFLLHDTNFALHSWSGYSRAPGASPLCL